MDSSGIITYRGLGSTVVLDTHGKTLTLTHEPPSEHSGTWVVPLDEIVDVLYWERTTETEGWARVQTVTGQHPEHPAFDPYSFRNGGEQLKTFCVLVCYAAAHVRMDVEGRATREVIGEEMASIRSLLDRFRNK